MWCKCFIVLVLINFIAAFHTLNKPNPLRELGRAIKQGIRHCQPQTPCQWKIYNYVDYPEIYFVNNYCVCKPGTKCDFHVNRVDGSYIEYRCKTVKQL